MEDRTDQMISTMGQTMTDADSLNPERCDAIIALAKNVKVTIAARDKEFATTKTELAFQLKAKDDQLKLKDELLASKDTELAAFKEQLEAKDAKLKYVEQFNETLCDKVMDYDVRINALEDVFKTNIKPLLEVNAKIKAKEALLSKAKDENHELRMELVALKRTIKDELAKAKQASKGKPLACIN